MKNFNNMFRGDKSDNDSERSDFRRKSFSPNRSGGRDRGGDRGGRGGDRGRMEMFEATCSDCGKKCQVPFRPTGDKPVYCSECFNNHGGAERSSRPERSGGRSFDRPRFQDRQMFDATCDKCGKRFELPFRPTGEKPVYCSECFERGGNPTTKRTDDKPTNQYKEQFEMLNSKLDKIMKALNITATPAKEVEKKEAVVTAKPVEEKVVVKEVVADKKEKKVVAKAKAVVAKPAAKKVVAKAKAVVAKPAAKKKKTTKK